MNDADVYRKRFERKWSNGRMQRSLKALGWTLEEVIQMEMDYLGL